MYRVSDVIHLARSQVNYREGKGQRGFNNIQKYSEQLPGFTWSDGKPWCATFAQWCLWQAGVEVPDGARSASCYNSVQAYKKANRFTEWPVTGAQVFYGGAGATHTGIVVRWDAVSIWTIEGNTNTSGAAEGDGVYARSHVRRTPYVYGYGLPYYPYDKGVSPGPWNGRPLARYAA